MEKIRIYELARDLNMENKILLEKIGEMDIPVKSHMSSLDDETVAIIKAGLLGIKLHEIEVTRIKPTIIRKRKKVVKKEAVHDEAASAPETHAEEPVETAPKEKESLKEIPIEKDLPEKISEAEELSQKKEHRPEQPIEIKKPPVLKKPKPKKVLKKRKKETPAKIIKLPVTPKKTTPVEKPKKKVEEAVLPEKPAVELKTVPEEIPEKDIKKGKQKKKIKEVIIKDKKFFKKKISFRRKEVVEGKALYDEGRVRGRKGRKGAKRKVATGQKTQITTPKAIKRRIKIDDTIMLSDLAKRMGVKANEMIAKLMSLGVMATVNQTIDFDTATLVSAEFDYDLGKASFEEEAILKVVKDESGAEVERPPVVTIMGHVDHGKTSLLDVLRKSKITENEAGGITQHIGAYNVSTDKGQIIFLDTPGHEAFTAMRARGAKVTDLVVLVVAADDGVMPQTIEAINHSKAANVPIIVAINKIDKANAEPERVQRQLAEVGLTPEEWGGDTIFVNVSAKENQGINEMLEMILLQAELMELTANPEKLARGHVIEAKLDPGRGPVATVLIQEGTLKAGGSVVCGIHHGKLRALLNDMGAYVNEAGPSMPVEIIGLSGVPMAGDEFIALSEEKDAKQISLHRIQQQRSKELAKTSKLSLEKLYEQIQEGEVKDLNLIIKADVHGSIEALSDSLIKLSNDEVRINVVHSGTGTITESDISLASVSNAIIIGFNVRPASKVLALANEENVSIRFYNIIYNIIKDIKDAILGMMSSTFIERTLGRAEVRELFQVPKVGNIAGCYVSEGKIERGRLLRLLRDGVVCYEGKNSSLRRFKDDVKEVQSGFECGIGIENYNDIKIGDIIECYYLEEIKPELE